MNLHPILPAKKASELTVKVARPLFWTDTCVPWPKRLSGATCFILRFRTGLVGVTADHVIAAFEHDKCHARKFVAMLRTAPLDLAHVLIDRDPDLDLATFSVTEEGRRASSEEPSLCRRLPRYVATSDAPHRCPNHICGISGGAQGRLRTNSNQIQRGSFRNLDRGCH